MKIPQTGFTLIELVLSMTIILIALMGTLFAINTAVMSSADPMIYQQAFAISESYLEEILNKEFPITPCPGGTRATYRNICNYAGLTEAPTNQHGTPIAGLSGYGVNVNVDTTGATLGSASGSSQIVRVDVTITHNHMTPATFSAYRTKY
jgi:MSHA pilin protein MshD